MILFYFAQEFNNYLPNSMIYSPMQGRSQGFTVGWAQKKIKRTLAMGGIFLNLLCYWLDINVLHRNDTTYNNNRIFKK